MSWREEEKEEVKKTETTEVLRGERYDPNKADAMIENVGEQIKVAYGWGYKDGNLDGYQRGFADGYYQHNVDTSGDAYAIGVEDLREALIAVSKWDTGHKVDVFHGAIGLTAILKNHTGQYIINQVQQHEKTMALMAATDKESEPINVGDEVLIQECDYGDTKAVVIDTDTDGTLWVLDDNGCVSEIPPSDDRSVIKTERHFNEIRHVLNKLRED